MQALVDRRKQEVAEMVCSIRDDKMRLLREQLEIIDQEKCKVRTDCAGLQQQVEVRNITTKIGDLNEKLDMSTTLIEPRENAFMMFDVERRGGGAPEIEAVGDIGVEPGSTRRDRVGQGSGVREGYEQGDASRVEFVQAADVTDRSGGAQGRGNVYHNVEHHPLMLGDIAVPSTSQGTGGVVGMCLIARVLARFGCVRISKTFPALCSATIEHAPTVHLKSTVIVRTVDYHGNPRTSGGDPVCAEVKNDRRGDKILVTVGDNDDGTYIITFKTSTAGRHVLNITIFERCIRDAPFTLDICPHINPTAVIGRGTGSGELQFRQPVGIAVDKLTGNILVLDTGNSRIQVINK